MVRTRLLPYPCDPRRSRLVPVLAFLTLYLHSTVLLLVHLTHPTSLFLSSLGLPLRQYHRLLSPRHILQQPHRLPPPPLDFLLPPVLSILHNLRQTDKTLSEVVRRVDEELRVCGEGEGGARVGDGRVEEG